MLRCRFELRTDTRSFVPGCLGGSHCGNLEWDEGEAVQASHCFIFSFLLLLSCPLPALRQCLGGSDTTRESANVAAALWTVPG